MNRKTFIKNCGVACMGTAMASLLPACSISKMVNGKVVGDDLVVLLDDFELTKGKKEFKKYLIVESDLLRYPVCIYRFSDDDYAAMFMRCTHQGTELQVFGDVLQCPAHGSEFNNRGVLQNGPAGTDLRTFPVTIEKTQLKISLKPL